MGYKGFVVEKTKAGKHLPTLNYFERQNYIWVIFTYHFSKKYLFFILKKFNQKKQNINTNQSKGTNEKTDANK